MTIITTGCLSFFFDLSLFIDYSCFCSFCSYCSYGSLFTSCDLCRKFKQFRQLIKTIANKNYTIMGKHLLFHKLDVSRYGMGRKSIAMNIIGVLWTPDNHKGQCLTPGYGLVCMCNKYLHGSEQVRPMWPVGAGALVLGSVLQWQLCPDFFFPIQVLLGGLFTGNKLIKKM